MTKEERIAKVRSFFTDELSLKVFDQRVVIGEDVKKELFPETLELVECHCNSKEVLRELMAELRSPLRETYIYGAGAGCKAVLGGESVKGLHLHGVNGIIDNNVKESRYGLPVIPFSEFLENHKDALVLNSVGIPTGRIIHQQCVDAGVEVISLFELDKSWDQYFDLPAQLGLVGENEVFVQAGCFNGDTQKSYINWFGDHYEKMITFEPNESQYDVSAGILSSIPRVELVKAGLSDRSGTVRFDLKAPGVSAISDAGTEEIQVVSLDEYMSEKRVTFIALDVEGEEYKALKGAEKIIRDQKPKLAISVYHKAEDIYELPELIKSIRPDYQLYLRHYHLLDMAETVLYAF